MEGFGKEVICPKRVHFLTYIKADREECGVEPVEVFVCSLWILPECTVISGFRFEGFS